MSGSHFFLLSFSQKQIILHLGVYVVFFYSSFFKCPISDEGSFVLGLAYAKGDYFVTPTFHLISE